MRDVGRVARHLSRVSAAPRAAAEASCVRGASRGCSSESRTRASFVAYQLRGAVADLATRLFGGPDVTLELMNVPPVRVCGRLAVEAVEWGQSAEGEGMIQLEQHRQAILDAAARHGARNVRVFGSVARGDDRTDSDIDLLVEMADDRSLLDLVALEQELESLLNRPVDVLTTQSLAPAIRARVTADARAL